MIGRCILDRCHPLTLLVWYMYVIPITVLVHDPIITAVSLLFGIVHIIMIVGLPKLSTVLYCAAFMTAAAIANPLFSHTGVTVLFFMNGLPVTLESLLYGVEMSAAACAVMLWCVSLTHFMTTDKITMLFGSVTPKLAVLLSLTLRFIPMIREKHRNIINAQKGFDGRSESRRTLKFYLSVYSALTSQLLEDSVEIADSMCSRGIRLKGRTFYSEFKIRRYDGVMMTITLLAMTGIIILKANGAGEFEFYPFITGFDFSVYNDLMYAAFAIVCTMCLYN
ncbi:MAG: energy-coupling factor transporter transmembrane protein EcfT [Clostridia bacterium]|nr:energy-coupling factor transporter transmembrane protein EcfT [Clostridia bacterium]